MLKKIIYDTREFPFEKLEKIKTSKFSLPTKIDKEKLLLNIYLKQQAFVPLIYITQLKNGDRYFIKGQEIISTLKELFEDKIELEFCDAMHEQYPKHFSNFKSFDKRLFKTFDFRVIFVDEIEKEEEIKEIIEFFV